MQLQRPARAPAAASAREQTAISRGGRLPRAAKRSAGHFRLARRRFAANQSECQRRVDSLQAAAAEVLICTLSPPQSKPPPATSCRAINRRLAARRKRARAATRTEPRNWPHHLEARPPISAAPARGTAASQAERKLYARRRRRPGSGFGRCSGCSGGGGAIIRPPPSSRRATNSPGGYRRRAGARVCANGNSIWRPSSRDKDDA